MLVYVGYKEIEEGKAKSCTSCPIALAIRRRFPELSEVSVDGWRVRAMDRNKPAYLYSYLPFVAKKFIVYFDNSGGENLDPFIFYLEDFKQF